MAGEEEEEEVVVVEEGGGTDNNGRKSDAIFNERRQRLHSPLDPITQ